MDTKLFYILNFTDIDHQLENKVYGILEQIVI